MQLFHHITVLALSEQEKEALLGIGVEFTRTMRSSRGETVMFELGENDPRYERVAALLRSFDAKRVRDFSMTVPTLREFVAKMVADGGVESFKREVAMREQWERGREVLRELPELAGKTEQALNLLDSAIAEAIQRNYTRWTSALCRHAANLSRSMGDRQRQIHYEEQALPFASEYSFAAYNFAQLLLSDGQLDRAERFAAEAYRQCIQKGTDADRDLITAILRQWPDVAQGA
jgi:tetratricopeptide (TPR) repeat protein